MSQIDQDAFLDWIAYRFPEYEQSGNEIKINDIWWINSLGQPDSDRKCWINLDKLCFRAFKSERTGHIIQLIAEVDGCSYSEAADLIGCEDSIRKMEEKLIKFFQNEHSENTVNITQPMEQGKGKMQLPSNCYPIDEADDVYPSVWQARKYLANRKLSGQNLFICLGNNRYRDRIVIPYYGPDGELIYFNTRSLSERGLRYQGPEKEEFGVGKGDVLWAARWPKKGAKVYLTEGEFDAMSLTQSGFNGMAVGGKSLSPKQIELLRPYEICLAFDSDKAGKDSFNIGLELRANGIYSVSFVRPPLGIKDWNKLLSTYNEQIVNAYVISNESPFTDDAYTQMKFNNI